MLHQTTIKYFCKTCYLWNRNKFTAMNQEGIICKEYAIVNAARVYELRLSNVSVREACIYYAFNDSR